jgi:hypothetical protein
MIEFNCQHCDTDISIASDQIGGELFCPACEKEMEFPELTPDMEAKLALAKAQAKVVPKGNLDHQKAEKMLQEPDSQETKVWKERLAQSFQAATFKEVEPNRNETTLTPPKDDKKNDSKKSGIRKIFDIFSDNK